MAYSWRILLRNGQSQFPVSGTFVIRMGSPRLNIFRNRQLKKSLNLIRVSEGSCPRANVSPICHDKSRPMINTMICFIVVSRRDDPNAVLMTHWSDNRSFRFANSHPASRRFCVGWKNLDVHCSFGRQVIQYERFAYRWHNTARNPHQNYQIIMAKYEIGGQIRRPWLSNGDRQSDIYPVNCQISMSSYRPQRANIDRVSQLLICSFSSGAVGPRRFR
jgi:hypothetical protein